MPTSPKPQRMEVIPGNIPEELTTKAQWIVWRWEFRNRKWTKPPYDPRTGNPAKSNDPQTWTDFKIACTAYLFKGWDGIGFMLTQPYCGIDFDDSLNKETKEIIEPAHAEAQSLNSYSEFSPSGVGFKTLVKAKLPKGGHHSNNHGIFCEGRYFCITGNIIPGFSKQIESRQEEIDALIRKRWPQDFEQGPGNSKKAIHEINSSPQDWEIAKREVSKHSKIMFHLMTPKPEDRSGHDYRLTSLCLEEGITDPNLLYQIILNNPHGKASSYPKTEQYIRGLISKLLSQADIHRTEKDSFPEEIITGVAGEFADLYSRHIESPRVFLFIGFLCCLGSILAGKLMLESERAFQTRLYILFLGQSADDRKSTAIDTPIDFFREFFGSQFNICWGVGSAEGLQVKLNETPEKRLLLCLDEFKALVNKCKIEGSVLLPCLNTLFEKNFYESRTKNSDIKVENAYLSILSASTIATYETIWSYQFTDIGFPNRIFIVPGTGERKHPLPQKIQYPEKKPLAEDTKDLLAMVGDKLEMKMTEEANAEFSNWYLSLDKTVHVKRLDTYALRFMPLLAVNEGKTQINLETVQKTIALMEWEKHVRELYDPIDATNEIARMEERIRRRLNQFPHTTGELKHFVKVSRDGLWVFSQAIKNLSEGIAREIRFNSQTKKWEVL